LVSPLKGGEESRESLSIPFYRQSLGYPAQEIAANFLKTTEMKELAERMELRGILNFKVITNNNTLFIV